jgi:chromosome segregation ATPase
MQNEISRLSLQGQNDNSQQIQALNNEVTDWKQKYEALAKLYAQLRKEHLDLLTKFKSIKDSNQKVSEDARKSIEKIQADLKAKSAELTEILVERNRLKGDADRIRLQYEGDLNRLKSELEETKKSLFDLSQSKGNEVETLVKRFNQEQQNLESLLKNKQSEIQLLTVQLGDVVAAMEKTKSVNFKFS